MKPEDLELDKWESFLESVFEIGRSEWLLAYHVPTGMYYEYVLNSQECMARPLEEINGELWEQGIVARPSNE